MDLLIRHGSPVDTMDVSGRTTALHAVDSHNCEALRIILHAGANPNPETPKGVFRSSPLIAATFGGLVEMVALLIQHGAEIDAYNPEGRTALQTAAKMRNFECAQILLQGGADLQHISTNGHSPLSMAIMHNSHAVLRLFFGDVSHLKRLQLLSIIAEFADLETMSILALHLRTSFLGDLASGLKTLRSRSDYTEELDNAFKHLVRRVKENTLAVNEDGM